MAEKKDEEKESLLWSGLKRGAGIAVGFVGAPLIVGFSLLAASVGSDVSFMGGGGDFDEVGSFGKGLIQGISAGTGAIAGFVFGGPVGAAVGAAVGFTGATAVMSYADHKAKKEERQMQQNTVRPRASHNQEQEMQQVRQKETSLGAPKRQSQQASPLPSGTTEVRRGSGPVSPSNVPSGKPGPAGRSSGQKR